MFTIAHFTPCRAYWHVLTNPSVKHGSSKARKNVCTSYTTISITILLNWITPRLLMNEEVFFFFFFFFLLGPSFLCCVYITLVFSGAENRWKGDSHIYCRLSTRRCGFNPSILISKNLIGRWTPPNPHGTPCVFQIAWKLWQYALTALTLSIRTWE